MRSNRSEWFVSAIAGTVLPHKGSERFRAMPVCVCNQSSVFRVNESHHESKSSGAADGTLQGALVLRLTKICCPRLRCAQAPMSDRMSRPWLLLPPGQQLGAVSASLEGRQRLPQPVWRVRLAGCICCPVLPTIPQKQLQHREVFGIHCLPMVFGRIALQHRQPSPVSCRQCAPKVGHAI